MPHPDRKHVLISKYTMKEIESIKKYLGGGTLSNIIASAVHHYRTSLSKPVEAIEKKPSAMSKSDICAALEGEVVDTGSGLMCEYKNYNMLQEFPQVIPLDMLNKDMLTNQYFPSKDKVLQVRSVHQETETEPSDTSSYPKSQA